MKRLTATQAFKVLQKSKEMFGDFKISVNKGDRWDIAYDEIPMAGENIPNYGAYNELKEMIREMLGHKRAMTKPYFVERYQGRPYFMNVPEFCYKELLKDIYGDSWYRDDDCLVRGDKTITRYTRNKTYRKLINEVQASLPATIEIAQ